MRYRLGDLHAVHNEAVVSWSSYVNNNLKISLH